MNEEQGLTLVFAGFMFGARIAVALDSAGRPYRLANEADLDRITRNPNGPIPSGNASCFEPVELAIVELTATGVDTVRRLRRAKASLPILAFGSHVQRELLGEARESGANLVVSNGAIVSRFLELVDRVRRDHSENDSLTFIDEDESIADETPGRFD